MKKRLDVLLVERGLAESRSQAQALVLAGRVRGFSKAGAQVDDAAELELVERPRFVSRGGEKLAHALEVLARTSRTRPASTSEHRPAASPTVSCNTARHASAPGCRGAQLHERLRADPRVTVIEGVNARRLSCEQLPFRPGFVTCDVSFISVRAALPPALACAAPAEAWRALVLVKPQFEAGRAEAGRGVVRDPEVHRRVLRDLAGEAQGWGPGGCRVVGSCDSGLPGPKGNREFFLLLAAGLPPSSTDELETIVGAAVGA